MTWRAAVLLAWVAGGAAAASRPVVTVSEHAGRYSVQGEFTTAAARATAWRVLTDYGHIESFVSSMKESHVARLADGRLRVRQVAVAGVFPFHRTLHLTLDVKEVPEQRIEFVDEAGEDFEHYAGTWALRADSAATVVTYTLDAAPRRGAPPRISRNVMRHGASELLDQVRTEMERRARP